tara:strand:- start:117 stop:344 length:228 start_codon:yes stop_codon:yes gene_type:complete
MSQIVDILTSEQKQELNDLLEVIATEANIVKKDYEDNPSDMTDEDVVVIHQDSTLLDNVDEKLADIGYNIIPKKK